MTEWFKLPSGGGFINLSHITRVVDRRGETYEVEVYFTGHTGDTRAINVLYEGDADALIDALNGRLHHQHQDELKALDWETEPES